MESVQTQCFMNIGEEKACQQMKSALAGAPMEDFTCSVKFCDTDLCTADENVDNESEEKSVDGSEEESVDESMEGSNSALQCYNCTQLKMNGAAVAEGSKACEGSEETCEDGMNACMTAKFSYKMSIPDTEEKLEMETVQTQCFINIGEERACQQMKSAMVEGDVPMEDFACSVEFCDTDLCTTSSGKTAHFLIFPSS